MAFLEKVHFLPNDYPYRHQTQSMCYTGIRHGSACKIFFAVSRAVYRPLSEFIANRRKHRHHHHQNAWAAEARSVDLVHRECPVSASDCKVPFLADGGCGVITNLVHPGLPWTPGWSSPARQRAIVGNNNKHT